MTGVSALLFFALTSAYFWITDARGGQTLGKALLDLRVVRSDGSPIGFGRAAVRTVMRVVDGLPSLFLLGFVVALASGGRRQRLGDLLADSRVVHCQARPARASRASRRGGSQPRTVSPRVPPASGR